MFDDKIKAWLYLTTKTDISRAKLYSLYKSFGSAHGILNAKKEELLKTELLSEEEAELILNPSCTGLDKYMGILEQNSVKVLTIECADYPEMLRHIPNPPLVLYCRGRFIDLNKYLCIASVGTRKPTPYGKRMTYTIVKKLCESGCIIVSGMAQGIDAVSHKAALDAGCPTVAFIANGVDIIYPKINAELFASVLKTGMVVSEYPLGTMPRSYYFPERNRLVSGVSKGVFISEAGIKSGTSITCALALSQNKDVFALPGNADSPMSAEPNRLIKSGAHAVTEADDIICHYTELYGDNMLYSKPLEEKSGIDSVILSEPENETDEKINVPADLGDEEKVLFVLKDHSLSIDEISLFTHISLEDLNMHLLMLEMNGKIKNDNGNYYLL